MVTNHLIGAISTVTSESIRRLRHSRTFEPTMSQNPAPATLETLKYDPGALRSLTDGQTIRDGVALASAVSGLLLEVDQIVATVGDSGRRHAVRVKVNRHGEPSSRCDCPDSHKMICAHGIAVVVAWASRPRSEPVAATGAAPAVAPARESPEPAPESGQPKAATAVPASLPIPKLDMQREDLMAWARVLELTQLVLTPVLEAKLDHIQSGLRVPPAFMSSTLGDLVVKNGYLGRAIVPPDLRRAALTRLLTRGDAATRSIEAERDLMRGLTPPSDPSLAGLYQGLLTLRKSLRDGTPARLPVPPGTPLKLIVDPPSIEQRESGVACRRGSGAEPAVQVSLTETPVVSCAARPGDCRCSIALGAVDNLLNVLGRPEHAERAHEIKALRGLSDWERALAVVETSPRPVPTWQPAWRVDLHAREVEPVVLEDGTARRMSDRRVLAAAERTASRADESVLAALRASGQATLRGNDGLLALWSLIGHPRVVMAPAAGTLLRSGDGKRVRLAVVEQVKPVIELTESPTDLNRLELKLRAGSLEWTLADAAAELARHEDSPVWLLPGDGVQLARVPSGLRKTLAALARPASFPSTALPSVLNVLTRHVGDVGVKASGALIEDEADAALALRLRVSRGDDVSLVVELLCTPSPTLPPVSPGEGASVLYSAGTRNGHGPSGDRSCDVVQRLRRDLAAERRDALLVVGRLGLAGELRAPNFSATIHDPRMVDAALAALIDESTRTPVDWEGLTPPEVTRLESAESLRVTIRAGARGNYLLDGVFAAGDDQLELIDVAAAIERGRTTLRLGDRLVTFGARLLEELRRLAAHPRSRDGIAVVAPGMVADALDALGAKVTAPARKPGGIWPPPGFTAELRPYQKDGTAWLMHLAGLSPGCILADDMGLGKTVQALALMCARSHLGPALVVAPTSLAFNWQREAARFAPGLLVKRLTSSRIPDGTLPSVGEVWILSYDRVVSMVETLAPITWATLVFDEAHALKNSGTKRSQAARQLTSDFTVSMTGTPLENRTSELWGLMNVTVPGLLGSADAFAERFIEPIERGGQRHVAAALAGLVRPFILRRHKADVLTDLPPKTEMRIDVELSPDERRVYDAIRRAARATAHQDGAPERRRMHILAALTRLRLCASDASLVAADLTFADAGFGTSAPLDTSAIRSSKLDAAIEVLEQLRAEGRRALVFSQFTSLLGKLRARLTDAGIAYRYLDGSTPQTRRAQEVDAFQAGDGDVFLLSLKAGGVGLNLTGADTVLHLDPWWNPAAESQATDRAHRSGQTRHVTVCRLVARGTIEEAVLALHDQKRALFEDVVDGATATGPDFEALAALLDVGDDED